MKKVTRIVRIIAFYICIVVLWSAVEKQLNNKTVLATMEKDETVFFLTDEWDENKSVLKLYQLEAGICKEINKHVFEDAYFQVTHFTEKDNCLIITGIEQVTGSVYVYFYDMTQEEKMAVEKKVYTQYAVYNPIKAIYKDGTLAVMNNAGKIYTDNKKVTLSEFSVELVKEETLQQIQKLEKNTRFLHLLVITVIYVVLCIVLWAATTRVLKKRRFFGAVQETILLISLILSCLMFCMFSLKLYKNKLEERIELSELYCAWQKERIENGNYISDWRKLSQQGKYIYFQTDVVSKDLEKESYVIVDSKSELIGSEVTQKYGAELPTMIEASCEKQELLSEKVNMNGTPFICTVVPIENAENNTWLIIRTSMMDCCEEAGVQGFYLLGIISSCWILLNIIINIYISVQANPMKKMEQIVENTRLKALHEYKSNDLLKCYERFIPHGFERIFGKQCIQDIGSGEIVEFAAVMTCIGFEKIVIHEKYRVFSSLMKSIQMHNDGNAGIILPENNNLEKINVLYEQTGEYADFAVEVGIALLTELIMQKDFKKETLPYIFIHATSTMCGIAGEENIAVPVAKSSEMETLNGYMTELCKYGVHMVITEQIKMQLKKTAVETRYIGYVHMDDSEEKTHLYEVLDACGQEEKYRKSNTISLFQKALEQFYNNDFYYARNNFLEVLKKCPEDEISRWYAFTCEDMFNVNVYEDIKHSLLFKK